MNNALSLGRLRLDVAAVLGVIPTAVAEDVPLHEQGLDSIRLMTLVEQWRARGAAVTFADLAERPTLNEWGALLTSQVDCDAPPQ
ncbi:phosphopantetheine-binding protein [Streptomyces sp. NPDC056480]|uniref:phosphopantetheine-binding protein n=1 Tax=Streptomyces sp. NPDC056480 TaxID=3345833 RepID=UPI0036965D32